MYILKIDVCYSAKIGILKQITTDCVMGDDGTRCLLLCKDRNFKANHNRNGKSLGGNSDVCYSAKIGILKQITTGEDAGRARGLMFVTLQR